jgi:hypothetical protein
VADEPGAGAGSADDTGCTRCDASLIFLGKRSFHEGGSYFLPGIFEGRTEIEMWACSDCGHVEFFMPLR